MRCFTLRCAAAVLVLLGAALAAAEDDVAVRLAEIDARIAAEPDEPLHHYQRAQLLARQGKHDDAYAAAQAAMAGFIRTEQELAWLQLETLEVAGHKVTVHVNMGPRERRPPENGIVRPVSFRIFAKDGGSLLETIDYEIGYLGGKPLTAAFGQTTRAGHANFGLAKPDSPYSEIRKQAVELIGRRLKQRE